MATSRPKSSLSESGNHKNSTPSTPRVSKLGRAGSAKSDLGSPSPRQNPRPSVDRSPSSVDSKPTVASRSNIATPDKPARAVKGAELQAQLITIQDELKKAKERLALVEKEKACALEELKDAKNAADEANEKLAGALLAQKKAEESSEIEKFRADELEQAGIEASQKREGEWQLELDNVRKQHAVDVATLLSTNQELQRVKQELAMTNDAKNTALAHADDAMKIAEINAEKVEILSGEVTRLKSLLDSQLESKSIEAQELVGKLNSEIVALTFELEKAKAAEEKLVEMEALVEGLRTAVNDTKMAETNANNRVDEFRKKVESLESWLEESNRSEKSMQEALADTKKELELNNSLLTDAESEITSLRRMVEELELTAARHKEDIEKSNQSLETARQEALDMGEEIEVLKTKIGEIEEEKRQALNNEKTISLNFESLVEEKNKLLTELGITREETEEVKKAMEGLTSALHEVSTEARETKEIFLVKQAEVDSAHAQIEELESALKNTKESYEARLVEARDELDCLKKAVERSKVEAENLRAEWNAKENSFLNSIKNSEEEIGATKAEVDKLAEALKLAENVARTAEEDGVRLADKLRLAETETSSVIESMEEAKAESFRLKEKLADRETELLSVSQAAKETEDRLLNRLSKAEQEAIFVSRATEELKTDSSQLKERLLDKENELQSIIQENDDLRTREAAALEKIKELSSLLAEATAKKAEEKLELTNGKKEHESLLPEEPKSIDSVEKSESEVSPAKLDESLRYETKVDENGNRKTDDNNSVEVVKDLFSEKELETESVEDESDSKIDCHSTTNGLSLDNADDIATSPTKQQQQQQQQKKKKLLQKFGSLLKKKSNNPK